ncbi:hypothetical protein LSTR_LSTR014555 [Laodelphax striatellus]|uniref:Uncharacterized protein n=1 Tax=Laodelphax striatellus TaxID=195883 RepID=A0A482WJG7_LAOST|nr:hypothetical protein LSTR_LSTR014555 [Laodelphax striatellus]
MYAAAGGASLASRQARRKENKKHHVISNDAVHEQFQRRFQQLHQEHARLYQNVDLNGRIPAHDIELMTMRKETPFNRCIPVQSIKVLPNLTSVYLQDPYSKYHGKEVYSAELGIDKFYLAFTVNSTMSVNCCNVQYKSTAQITRSVSTEKKI